MREVLAWRRWSRRVALYPRAVVMGERVSEMHGAVWSADFAAFGIYIP